MLIDQLRIHTKPYYLDQKLERYNAFARSCKAHLDEHLPVLNVQNVAEYCYSETPRDWILTDIPNLAPPFESFWIEYKWPPDKSIVLGFLLTYYDRNTPVNNENGIVPLANAELIYKNNPSVNKASELFPVLNESGWVLNVATFSQLSGELAGPNASVWFEVTRDGGISGRGCKVEPWDEPDISEQDKRNIITTLYPAFLSISFLHCKNVAVQTEHMSKPLAKKWHNRYNLWPTPYKTLVIEPMKAILRKDGKSEETGLHRAIHICRGHFKDYREGNGLFGKYHVMVWQPSLVRGTKRYDLDDNTTPPRTIEFKLPGDKQNDNDNKS